MRALPRSYWFVGLLCVLLIGARISGAHWHLCFDHAEPPQTVHVGDIDHHGDFTSNVPHQDVDLQLVDDGLLKNLLSGVDAPTLLSLILCLWLLPRRARSVPHSHYRVPAFLNDPRPLHAPPRAPPL